MSQPEEVARRRNGTFAKGQTGNPGGRPGNLAKLRKTLTDGSEAVAKVVLAAAKKGDMQACRLVLERIVPTLKPMTEPVKFDLDDTDLITTARSIMRAIAAGTLPAEQGKVLLDAVLGMSRVIEVADLERRLKAIEASMEGDQ